MNEKLLSVVKDVQAEKRSHSPQKDVLDGYVEEKHDIIRDKIKKIRETSLKGKTLTSVAYQIGMEPTAALKFMNGVRGLPSGCVATCCYDLLEMSCHEFYCDEPPRPIQIPKIMESALAAMQFVGSQREYSVLYNVTTNMFSQKLPDSYNPQMPNDWAAFRMQELADNYQISPYALFSSRTVSPYPDSYPQMLYTQRLVDADKVRAPRVPTILYLSVLSGITVDYFLALDYTRFCPVANSKGEVYKDQSAINLISLFLRLLPKDQEAMCSYIVRQSLFS